MRTSWKRSARQWPLGRGCRQHGESWRSVAAGQHLQLRLGRRVARLRDSVLGLCNIMQESCN